MKKELIGVDNLDAFVCKHDSTIYVDPSAYILTPGAKDELGRRHITIVYGPCPEYANCGHQEATSSCTAMSPELESFVLGVAAVLKKEYGITDPEKLREVTLQAVQTLKQSL